MKPIYADVSEIDRIDAAIRAHKVVVSRDAEFASLDELEQFGRKFGPLRKQVWEQDHPVLEMNALPGEGRRWYNSTEGWPLHFDGIITINANPIMPRTLLFGKNINRVEGGVTYFYDSTEIMAVLQEQYGWDPNTTEMISYKYPRLEETFTFRMIRIDPHLGRPYPFLDEWFTSTDPRRKAEFRAAMEQCEPYFHEWRTGDVLFWSNEGFIHGRTEIDSGDRVLWRLIVNEA